MTIAADGVVIATAIYGVQNPDAAHRLVFTTGWANDRSVWLPLVDQLSNAHSSTIWDLRGHGESQIPAPGSYTRQHALGDLQAVVHEAGVPAVLVGHSLGGYLSLAYTIENPKDISALVLIASGPGFRNPDSRRQWNNSVKASAKTLNQPPGVYEISLHVDSYVIDHLSQITCPVLVLLGERDHRFNSSASLFERELDVRKTVVIPGQGHMVHLKAPTDCAAAIRKFTENL